MNVQALRHRYQLKTRQALYDRLKCLNLTLVKDHQGHGYATAAQIAQLDDLHQWLQRGGSMKTYTPTTAPLSVLTEADHTADLTTIDTEAVAATALEAHTLAAASAPPTELASLLNVLTTLLQTVQVGEGAHSPLYVWEQLDRACEKEWILTTSQIKELTGVQPYGDVYEYGTFCFQRHGRIGREAGWEVWKNGY